MIKIKNISNDEPYVMFKKLYDEAYGLNQKAIEAICISSYSEKKSEVNSRYVNLKFIEDKEFIFFTNYESPKANEFNENNQISALFFWNKLNTQIRIKAKISKKSKEYNDKYFFNRNANKNALAISSRQSETIESYEMVKQNFKKTLKKNDLKICPDYWGAYSFTPYYFEFWKGHENRLNKRLAFMLEEKIWKKNFLQP